jgi:hypothetical protein
LTSSSKPDWHALLAPLPADAAVGRKPVSPEELARKPEAKVIAGWESLTVDLSAGAAGLRHLLVTLDATGTPISAGDWVLYCRGNPVEYTHESIGGRIEPDGSFNGTRWRSVSVEVAGEEEPEQRETERSDPAPQDIEALMGLVRELLRRAPKAEGPPR